MGDVGIAYKMLEGKKRYNLGTVPQRTQSFLATLDLFLQTPGTIFSSVVPAETTTTDGPKGNTMIADVLKLIGMKY